MNQTSKPKLTMKNHLARIALTLVPAIFLCATAAGQAQTSSRIVFHNGVLIQKQHTTYYQLFSMNPDGSALTQKRGQTVD
jgi:hypothetical protein